MLNWISDIITIFKLNNGEKGFQSLIKDISLIFSINLTQHWKSLMNDLEILYRYSV